MSTGRPRATSRDTIADAACELFLEQGFEGTTVADITRRAGVSRSSFFNYFTSKSDVLWAGLDARLDAAHAALLEGDPVSAVVSGIGERLELDALAIALTNRDPMGLADELDRERAVRQARLQRDIAARLMRDGAPRLAAEVRAGAVSAAVFAAVWAWADRTSSGPSIAQVLAEALAET